MEARFYLETEVIGDSQATKRRTRPNRAKLVFVFTAIFLSALLPYLSFTIEATRISPIQPIQQLLLVQCLLYAAIFVALTEAFATPTNWRMRQRKTE